MSTGGRMRIGSRKVQTEPSKALTATRGLLLSQAKPAGCQALRAQQLMANTASGNPNLHLVQHLTPDTDPHTWELGHRCGITWSHPGAGGQQGEARQYSPGTGKAKGSAKRIRDFFREQTHSYVRQARERELCMLQHSHLQHVPLESRLCSGQVTCQSGPCSFCYLPLKHPVTNTGRNKTLDHRGCRPHLTWQSFCSQ